MSGAAALRATSDRGPLQWCARLTLLALLVAASAAPSEGQRLKFWKRSALPDDGTPIEINGSLTDSTGRALPGVAVVFQGARRAFSYREFRRADFNPVEVRTTTDSDGSFHIDWQWHKYYNHFRVQAVLEVPRGSHREEVVLAETDITSRMRGSLSLLVQLVAQDTTVLDELRAFEGSLRSEDQRRIYADQGKPDRVDRVPGERAEETWWYFDRGTAFRFEEGRYVELDRFDPVRADGESGGG